MLLPCLKRSKMLVNIGVSAIHSVMPEMLPTLLELSTMTTLLELSELSKISTFITFTTLLTIEHPGVLLFFCIGLLKILNKLNKLTKIGNRIEGVEGIERDIERGISMILYNIIYK